MDTKEITLKFTDTRSSNDEYSRPPSPAGSNQPSRSSKPSPQNTRRTQAFTEIRPKNHELNQVALLKQRISVGMQGDQMSDNRIPLPQLPVSSDNPNSIRINFSALNNATNFTTNNTIPI